MNQVVYHSIKFVAHETCASSLTRDAKTHWTLYITVDIARVQDALPLDVSSRGASLDDMPFLVGEKLLLDTPFSIG